MTLVDIPTAAFAAGVKPSTIRSWIRDGRLTAYGTLRRRLVDLDEVYRTRKEPRS